MLQTLEQQRALIPYRFVAIGSMPFVGFFFFGVSWFRDASLYTQVGRGRCRSGAGVGDGTPPNVRVIRKFNNSTPKQNTNVGTFFNFSTYLLSFVSPPP